MLHYCTILGNFIQCAILWFEYKSVHTFGYTTKSHHAIRTEDKLATRDRLFTLKAQFHINENCYDL